LYYRDNISAINSTGKLCIFIPSHRNRFSTWSWW